MDLAIRIVVPLVIAVALFVPLLNVMRRRGDDEPLRGADARRVAFQFAAVSVPLGVLIIIGAEALYD